MNKSFTAGTFSVPGKITLVLPDKAQSKIELQGKTLEISNLMTSAKNFNPVGTLVYRDVTKKVVSTV